MTSAPDAPNPGSAIDLYQSGPSSSDQFLRKWALTLLGANGAEFTISDSNGANALSGGTAGPIDDPLRIVFQTRQARTGVARGSAEITVYNLSRQTYTLAGLRQVYNRMILRAGYQTGAFGTIFDGQIIDFRQGRDPDMTETYLRITGQTGDLAANTATVNASFAKGTTAAAAVKAIAGQMTALGATLGLIVGIPETRFIRARTYVGMAIDAIQKHGEAVIQNGQLNIAPTHSNYTIGSTIIVNASTGLIGRADLTGANGAEFDVLLNPNMQIGSPVQINQQSVDQASGLERAGAAQIAGQTTTQGPGYGQLGYYLDPSADGTYIAIIVEHRGDTRGNDWTTHVAAWPNGASPGPAQAGLLQTLPPSAGQIVAANTTPNLPPDYSSDTGGF